MRPRDELDDDDFRRSIGWWEPENFERNAAIVAQLKTMAEAHDATVAQLAIAWLLARSDDVVPIPGSRNPDRVAQNVAAAQVTLTAEDLAALGQVVPEGGVGSRRRRR